MQGIFGISLSPEAHRPTGLVGGLFNIPYEAEISISRFNVIVVILAGTHQEEIRKAQHICTTGLACLN